jgi:hypothetical protein
MKKNVGRLALFLIVWMIIPALVVGLVPGDITIWSEPAQAIAGGGDVVINVKIENDALGAAPTGAAVQASVIGIDMDNSLEDPETLVHVKSCKIRPASQKTKDGLASFSFTPSTRAGTVLLQFSVEYTDGKTRYQTQRVYFQPIGQAILLEGVPSSGEICSGSSDLEFQWVLRYTGQGTVAQEVYYQINDTSQNWPQTWIRHSTLDAGMGPIDGTVFGIGVDTHDRMGYYRIKVFAHEEGKGGLQNEWVGDARQLRKCANILIT